MSEPIIDRDFAEKFLTAADRPLDYGVYLLFHDWWAEAPQRAIDEYVAEIHDLPGATEFVAARYLAEPLTLDRLSACAPGTLGEGLHRFLVDHDLTENLATDYRAFNEKLSSEGTLDRLPADLSYMIVRGFQIHDTLHVLNGFDPSPTGELAQAAFHFAQLRFPYHAMRVAVTTAHVAFVSPKHIASAMDALAEGWVAGRQADNLHFVRWENELDTSLEELRDRFNIPRRTLVA